MLQTSVLNIYGACQFMSHLSALWCVCVILYAAERKASVGLHSCINLPFQLRLDLCEYISRVTPEWNRHWTRQISIVQTRQDCFGNCPPLSQEKNCKKIDAVAWAAAGLLIIRLSNHVGSPHGMAVFSRYSSEILFRSNSALHSFECDVNRRPRRKDLWAQ